MTDRTEAMREAAKAAPERLFVACDGAGYFPGSGVTSLKENANYFAQKHPRFPFVVEYAKVAPLAATVPAAQYRAIVAAFDALARGDFRALGTVHEDIQGSVDAIVAKIRSAVPATETCPECGGHGNIESVRGGTEPCPRGCRAAPVSPPRRGARRWRLPSWTATTP